MSVVDAGTGNSLMASMYFGGGGFDGAVRNPEASKVDILGCELELVRIKNYTSMTDPCEQIYRPAL
jgi:hypothetical protein